MGKLAAIEELVQARSLSSPDEAMEWSLRIEDEALRQQSMERAGRSWRREDPDGFQAWLASSGLPPEVQHALLQPARARAAARAAARASDGEAREPGTPQ